MYTAGILDSETRVELVDGVLIEMNPPGPQHAGTVRWLNRHFMTAVAATMSVVVQDAFVTSDHGFVVPDVFVCEALSRDLLPETALLVVEVAHTSQDRDLEKAATYAAAGVAEYWIVDLDRDELLVHRQPRGGVYESVERFAPGDAVSPLIDVPPVDVSELLGR
jgi:Uma2 family endonuclease